MTQVVSRYGMTAGTTLLHRSSSGVTTRPSSAPSARPSTAVHAEKVRRGGLWDWRGWTVLVAVGCAVVVGAVHARGMYTAPIRFDDEGTYVAQADTLLTQGRLAPYTYWYDHPPLGWMIVAGWLAGPGALWSAPNLIGSGRQLMLVLDVASVVLVVLLGRRAGMPRTVAAVAALLYGLCPLALTYHRMVLLDNIATPLLLGAFLLAMSPGRRLSAALASGMLISSAVLVKETTLLFLPFVAWMLWRSFPGPTRRMCLTVFGLGVALPGLLYPLFALTKDELIPGTGHVSLWDGVFFQLLGRQSSGSIFNATSDAHAVLTGWLSTDPYLVVGACVLVVPALFLRGLRPLAAALLFMGLAVLRPGYLPVPYVVGLIPFAALVVTAVPGALVRGAVNRLRRRARSVRDIVASRILPVLTVGALATAIALTTQAVAPHWYYRDVSLMQTNFDRPYLDSTAWLQANVPTNATLLVDDVTWTSLHSAGYPQVNLIWFTKPNADSDVDRRVPDWRSIDYVVSSDIMRTSRQNGGTVQNALRNSVPVAAWGTGSNQIVVSKVTK